jgi:hypothetical protein
VPCQGEYPLASASAVERSQEKGSVTGVVEHRGRDVVLTFSMQGDRTSQLSPPFSRLASTLAAWNDIFQVWETLYKHW